VLIAFVPSKSPERASAPDSLKNFSAPVARLAAFPFLLITHIGLLLMDSGPMRIRFAAGVSKNVDLRGSYIKQGPVLRA